MSDMTQDDKSDTTTTEQSSSDPRAIKRRPKTYRVKVTKQRTAIEVCTKKIERYPWNDWKYHNTSLTQ